MSISQKDCGTQRFPFPPHILPAMSTSNLNAARCLTREEQILHHYASAVKKDLERYRASAPGNEKEWAITFTDHLVFHFRQDQLLLSYLIPLENINELFCRTERHDSPCESQAAHSPAVVEPY
jgi:hypothetical protein